MVVAMEKNIYEWGIVRCHVWLPQGNPAFFQWVSCQITFEKLPALPLSTAARNTQRFWGRRLCRSRDAGGVRGQKRRKSDWHLGQISNARTIAKNLTVNKHSSLQLHYFSVYWFLVLESGSWKRWLFRSPTSWIMTNDSLEVSNLDVKDWDEHGWKHVNNQFSLHSTHLNTLKWGRRESST